MRVESEKRSLAPDLDPATRLFALIGLPTGAGLVVYLVASVSLLTGLAVCTAVAVGAFALVWRRLDTVAKQYWHRRFAVGAGAGAIATVAYDISRFALVGLADLPVSPWEAVPIFGQLLTGAAPGSGLAWAVGFLYHVANGVGFGLAYTVLFGRRGVVAGIAFALVLEAAMLALYPGWLDIRARQEFASVTMLGHVGYGATLGLVAPRLIARYS